jgi:PAS domain S-box-containing protein
VVEVLPHGAPPREDVSRLPVPREPHVAGPAAAAPACAAGPADGGTADRRLQEAYALTGLAWWEWETGTGRLRWSEGMKRLAGLDGLDRPPTIDDWVPLLDPADADVSAAHEQAALRDGTPYRHVFRVRTPRASCGTSSPGPARCATATAASSACAGPTLDVSEREVAQRALAASEAHFRVTFDHAPHGMVMIWLQGERAGRLLRANDAFARLLGRTSAGELDGMALDDWTPAGDRRRSQARLDDMAAGRSRGRAYSRRYLRADGTVVHAWVTIAAVDDEHGRPQFAIAHCIDDTERRQHVRRWSAWRTATP